MPHPVYGPRASLPALEAIGDKTGEHKNCLTFVTK